MLNLEQVLLITSDRFCSLFFSFQDGHEICFVGDEAFRELSKIDPDGDSLLNTVSIQYTPYLMT